MKGDFLASGGHSATFAVAPNLKFDEAQMRSDLSILPKQSFITKYMITEREYDLINHGDEEKVNDFAEQMRRQGEFYSRGLQTDAQQAESLNRDCFITPYIAMSAGRVIVDRDEPDSPKGERGRLLIPKALRKEKTLLPTTGHVIRATTADPNEAVHLFGKRILFGSFSGTAICFKNYPTWILLDVSEILAIIDKEDIDLRDQELEPMV